MDCSGLCHRGTSGEHSVARLTFWWRGDVPRPFQNPGCRETEARHSGEGRLANRRPSAQFQGRDGTSRPANAALEQLGPGTEGRGEGGAGSTATCGHSARSPETRLPAPDGSLQSGAHGSRAPRDAGRRGGSQVSRGPFPRCTEPRAGGTDPASRGPESRREGRRGRDAWWRGAGHGHGAARSHTLHACFVYPLHGRAVRGAQKQHFFVKVEGKVVTQTGSRGRLGCRPRGRDALVEMQRRGTRSWALSGRRCGL